MGAATFFHRGSFTADILPSVFNTFLHAYLYGRLAHVLGVGMGPCRIHVPVLNFVHFFYGCGVSEFFSSLLSSVSFFSPPRWYPENTVIESNFPWPIQSKSFQECELFCTTKLLC